MVVNHFLGAPGFSLFIDSGSAAPPIRALRKEIRLDGLVFDETAPSHLHASAALHDVATVQLFSIWGECGDCARRVHGRVPGPLDKGLRSEDDELTLIRVVADEGATPGLNWALGMDASRVCESLRVSEPGAQPLLDWLLTIPADEEDDLRERISCGVLGEAFRKSKATTLSVAAITSTYVGLPESCRTAVAMGALPHSTKPLWRVPSPSPSASSMPDELVLQRQRLRNCLAPAPFWLTGCAAQARHSPSVPAFLPAVFWRARALLPPQDVRG